MFGLETPGMMNEYRLTEKESTDFLEELFPSGLAGSDIKNLTVSSDNDRKKVFFRLN